MDDLGTVLDMLHSKVKWHMKWDDGKVLEWFRTPNPGLGQVSPFEMVAMGRSEKLERFIDNAIEESKPGLAWPPTGLQSQMTD